MMPLKQGKILAPSSCAVSENPNKMFLMTLIRTTGIR